MLYSLHQFMAAKVPEMEIDREESKLLADSITEVAAHYNTVVDPKIVAWAGLIGVASSIYGPRVIAIKARKARGGKAQQAQQTQQAPTDTGMGAFSFAPQVVQ